MPSPNENYEVLYTNNYSYWNGSSWSPTVNLSVNAKFSKFSSTTSVSTPGFGRLKRRELPINPYDKSTSKFVDDVFNWRIYVKTGSVETQYSFNTTAYYMGCSCSRGPSADDPTQRAVARLNDQMKLEKTNTSVAMAEAHKTAAAVAKSATKIYEAVKALKTGDLVTLARTLGVARPSPRKVTRARKTAEKFSPDFKFGPLSKSERARKKARPLKPRTEKDDSSWDHFLADTWLEYSYGWKPLLNDVYSHAEAFATVLVDTQFVVRYVVASAKTQRADWFPNWMPNSNWIFDRRTEDRLWVKIGVNYRIPPGSINPINVFGVQNPLIVAWEIVPFSFVADWFLPIGAALEAITASSGLVFHSGWKTERNVHLVEETFRSNGITTTTGGSSTLTAGGGKNFKEWFHQKRSSLIDFPSYGFPQWKDPTSIEHALSAISLLTSIFLKK